ncbi:hypothetical protein GmHk_01G001941 [Glycine max]|nr:hypothetical protein GmHk_01G001941 [Glycine max]
MFIPHSSFFPFTFLTPILQHHCANPPCPPTLHVTPLSLFIPVMPSSSIQIQASTNPDIITFPRLDPSIHQHRHKGFIVVVEFVLLSMGSGWWLMYATEI